jgi:hypothetical protein
MRRGNPGDDQQMKIQIAGTSEALIKTTRSWGLLSDSLFARNVALRTT